MREQTSTWPIDMNAFAQIAGPKAAQLLPQLLPIYLEDGDLLTGWMAEALQVEDAMKLQQAAHRLKGNSASMGIHSIAEIATQLEKLGKTGDFPTAVSLFAQFSEEYQQVKAALLSLADLAE